MQFKSAVAWIFLYFRISSSLESGTEKTAIGGHLIVSVENSSSEVMSRDQFSVSAANFLLLL